MVDSASVNINKEIVGKNNDVEPTMSSNFRPACQFCQLNTVIDLSEFHFETETKVDSHTGVP